MSAKEILKAALQLDPAERAHLAQQLLESIDDHNGGLDAEWLDELERRAKEIEAGAARFVTWDEARAEIEQELDSRSR